MADNSQSRKKISLERENRIFVTILLISGIIVILNLAADTYVDYLHDLPGRTPSDTLDFIYHIHVPIYAILSIFCFSAALYTGFSLRQRVLIPLRQFSDFIKGLSQGRQAQRIPASDAPEEIEELYGAFEKMAQNIDENIKIRHRFLTGVVHELNTPLTTLRGNLEAIVDGVFSPEEKVGLLLDETIYLQRMVDDLRVLSLAEAGELPLKKTPTDANILIQKAMLIQEPLFIEKGIILEGNLNTLPETPLDQDRFNQIFYNLLINALKYTGEKGKVLVTSEVCSQDGKTWLKISVQDNGTGISSEHLPLIFEQFYRVDRSRSKSTGGSGIGLALVKRMVEAHGGLVDVTSTPGEGSTFCAYFPTEALPR